MPRSLREAHSELDERVASLYRAKPFSSGEERVAHLLKIHQERDAVAVRAEVEATRADGRFCLRHTFRMVKSFESKLAKDVTSQSGERTGEEQYAVFVDRLRSLSPQSAGLVRLALTEMAENTSAVTVTLFAPLIVASVAVSVWIGSNTLNGQSTISWGLSGICLCVALGSLMAVVCPAFWSARRAARAKHWLWVMDDMTPPKGDLSGALVHEVERPPLHRRTIRAVLRRK